MMLLSGSLVRTAVLATVLAGFTGACATNPVTGRRELSFVSESQEIAMGQQGAEEVRQSMGLVQDAALQEYVRGIGMRLARESERPNLPWSFEVVDDAAVNAFALPGGPIFVTRGILAFMQNEAELASVLGHEIGHITAKHSVQQISRTQLAQGLLGVGSILSNEVAAVAGIASQGLGLMFLKYGRDAETQADDLGFKYALGDGYDVRAMQSMFAMLSRVSGGANAEGRLPQWLSTHPDPENRIIKTEERLATVSVDFSKSKLNRDPFIQRMDGLIYGENPRHGYFEGTRFNHPDMAFRLDFPSGWQTQNQAAAVVGMSSAQDAMVVLSVPGKTAPAQALTQFLGQQGIQAGATSNASINGLPAASAEFQAQTESGAVIGRITYVSHGGSTFQLLGYTPAAQWASYRGALSQSIQSFGRLTDQAALAKQPSRIRLVRLTRDMTVEAFHRQYPSSVSVTAVAYINGVNAPTDMLKSGTMAKRVQ